MANQQAIDAAMLGQFNKAEEVITHVRNIRKQNNIANKVKIDLKIKANNAINKEFDSVISKMTNLSSLEYITKNWAMPIRLLWIPTSTLFPLEMTLMWKLKLQR
jgi:valyl-tRNA synthetase